MSNHVEALVSSMHKTNEWLRDVAEELGDANRHHAYAVLRATLHALRERLSAEQSAHLSAQLPLVLRGTYFEGWKPSHTAQHARTRQEFMNAVRGQLHDSTPLFHDQCENQVLACLRVLARHIDFRKLQDSLPRDLRELWPTYV